MLDNVNRKAITPKSVLALRWGVALVVCLLGTLSAYAQDDAAPTQDPAPGSSAPPKLDASTHSLQDRIDAAGPSENIVEVLRRSLRSRRSGDVPAPQRGRNTSDQPPGPPVPIPNPTPLLYRPVDRAPGSCPNVVLLILDTLRADKLSCYGYKARTSPRLDELAEAGVRFANVLVQSTWTRPSIGSFLTSRYPRELGLYQEKDQILSDDFVTLAEALQSHGYTTIGFTANPNINTTFNFHQGFDEYIDSNVIFSWMRNEDGAVQRGVSPLPDAPDMFQRALDVIESTGNEGPYYLQFNVMEVHEWVANRPGTNMLRAEYENLFSAIDPYAKYLRLIRQLTDDVHAFVERLTELPGWEDTLFVMVSDHGEGLGDHSRVQLSSTHGYIVYESVTHVPWIMYRKGWKPATPVVEQEVRMLDMMPTVLDLVGATPPDGMQGVSMLPVLEGRRKLMPLPRYHIVETEFGGREKVAVYGRRFVYVENRTPMGGLPVRELQFRGTRANGEATDVLSRYTAIGDGMRDFLNTWELQFPKRPPTAPLRAISEEEIDQLKGIGYL